MYTYQGDQARFRPTESASSVYSTTELADLCATGVLNHASRDLSPYGTQRPSQPTRRVKRDKSDVTHGIPSNDGGESICNAARVRARRDIAQARAGDTVA